MEDIHKFKCDLQRVIDDFRHTNHKDSGYVAFEVMYYGVSHNGELLKSPSINVTEDIVWGLARIKYGTVNYRGYIDPEYHIYLFSENGLIDHSLTFGEWILDEGLNFHIANNNSVLLKNPKKEIDEKIMFAHKVYPLIQNRRTIDEARIIESIVGNGDYIPTKEELIDALLLEIGKLNNRLSSIESKTSVMEAQIRGFVERSATLQEGFNAPV